MEKLIKLICVSYWMQKRIVAGRSGAVKLRVERLRKRGLRSLRGKLIQETLRESHAREFFVRVHVLPKLKKEFGKDLLAVTIHGSVQLGVRKASNKASGAYGPLAHSKPSDIDIAVAVPKGSYTISKEIFEAASELSQKLSEKFKCHFHVYGADEFLVHHQSNLRFDEPFQVVFGKELFLNAGNYVEGMKFDLSNLPKLRQGYNRGKYFWRLPETIRRKK